jgi:2-amino-4-hydroxy-6-hydroxymethyldihydropteridine diphosphokinase
VETAHTTLAYVGLGSNLGDRLANLQSAIQRMRSENLEVKRLSLVYETEPVETFPQPSFLNLVAELKVNGSPEALLTKLLEIEQALGRKRDINKGPRPIDLDLLLFGEEVRDSEFLKLPHPRLAFRRFVLAPLAELSPNLRHPVLHQTFTDLLVKTSDNSRVHIFTDQLK